MSIITRFTFYGFITFYNILCTLILSLAPNGNENPLHEPASAQHVNTSEQTSKNYDIDCIDIVKTIADSEPRKDNEQWRDTLCAEIFKRFDKSKELLAAERKVKDRKQPSSEISTGCWNRHDVKADQIGIATPNTTELFNYKKVINAFEEIV